VKSALVFHRLLYTPSARFAMPRLLFFFKYCIVPTMLSGAADDKKMFTICLQLLTCQSISCIMKKLKWKNIFRSKQKGANDYEEDHHDGVGRHSADDQRCGVL
jgi:hypothetical protein